MSVINELNIKCDIENTDFLNVEVYENQVGPAGAITVNVDGAYGTCIALTTETIRQLRDFLNENVID